MTFSIFRDLAPQTTEQLMFSLRRQFAYSVGMFVLLLPFMLFTGITGETIYPRQGETLGLVTFAVSELCVWFTFIRHWRELRRRQRRLEADASTVSHGDHTNSRP